MLGFKHLEKRVAEEVRVLTVVESKAHFVKIGIANALR